VSAARVLADARVLGVKVEAADQAHLRVQGPREARDRIRPALVAHKRELLRYLTAQCINEANAVARAARLLRECRWDPIAPPCDFHIGRPREICRRCGAPLAEHYGR
jgi:hypothetical protein